MSVESKTYIVCDIQGPDCQDSFGKDLGKKTAKEVRTLASFAGWYHEYGEDICPVCHGIRCKGFKQGHRRFEKDDN